jgi:broad specificity phosphatase PhoE
MRLLFTRHGESEANLARIISNRDLAHHLTEKGVGQAHELAAKLVDSAVVQMIYCSPIPRARETAEIVAGRLGLSIAVTPALREFDCGMMEGRGDEEAWKAHNTVIKAWDEDQDYDCRIPPDGESFNDIKRRFLPFIAELLSEVQARPGDILMISHGSMLHQMLPVVLANVDRQFTQQNPIGNCKLIIANYQDKQLFCSDWAGKSF